MNDITFDYLQQSSYNIDPTTNNEEPNFASDRYKACYNKIINSDKNSEEQRLQLNYLERLYTFDLGKHLIDYGNLDAYWTDYITYYPLNEENQRLVHTGQSHGQDSLLLYLTESCPIFKATQERFQIFVEAIKSEIQLYSHKDSDMTIASFGCGCMRDICSQDFSNLLFKAKIFGIDTDRNVMDLIRIVFAQHQNIEASNATVEVIIDDALAITLPQKADLIVSNGINIYEHDDEAVTSFYKNCAQNLNPAGSLIISFLTPPLNDSRGCPWNMENVDSEDLYTQKQVLSAANVSWTATRTYEQTISQLEEAGFTTFTYLPDSANMFPTIVAKK